MQSFSCRQCRSLLSPYRDGELAAAETAEVEAHLATCQSCRGYMRQLNRTLGTLALLDEDFATPVAEIRQRVWAAIRDISLSQEERASLPTEELRSYTTTTEAISPDAPLHSSRLVVLTLSLLLAIATGAAMWLGLRDTPRDTSNPGVADAINKPRGGSSEPGERTASAELHEAADGPTVPALTDLMALCERGLLLRDVFAEGMSLQSTASRDGLLTFAAAMAEAADDDTQRFGAMADHPEFPAAGLFAQTQAETARQWHDQLQALSATDVQADLTPLAWQVEHARNLVPPWSAACLAQAARGAPLASDGRASANAFLAAEALDEDEATAAMSGELRTDRFTRFLQAVAPDSLENIDAHCRELELLARGCERTPVVPLARYWLARFLWRAGRFADAVAWFNCVPGEYLLARLDPASVEALQDSLRTEITLWLLAHGMPLNMLQHLHRVACFWQTPQSELAESNLQYWTEVSLSAEMAPRTPSFTAPTQEYFQIAAMIRFWQLVDRLRDAGDVVPDCYLAGSSRSPANALANAGSILGDPFPRTTVTFDAIWVRGDAESLPDAAQTVSCPTALATFLQRDW